MDTTETVLLAAQPIYDRDNALSAVELLYRRNDQLTAADVGDSQATSELLFNLCTGITEQTDHYHSPAFINVSGDFLLSQQFLPIDPDRVVIELVERIKPSANVVESVRQWRRKGFRFALDDFEFEDTWEALVDLADIVKVDVLGGDPAAIARQRERFDRPHLQWLAERVEDMTTHDEYHSAGFDLFQGYFYARPTSITGERLNATGVQAAHLLGLMFSEDPDVEAIIEAISTDPGLAVSLLRVVNSPLYRATNELTSIRDVVLRLGLDNLRRWVMLISVVGAASPGASRMILTRAQMCSLLAARSRSGASPDQALLAGLLSGAESLFGVDQSTFIGALQLDSPLRDALLSRTGPIGRILHIAINTEYRLASRVQLEQLDPRLLKLYKNAADQVQALLNEL
ncbi:EAL and modified HD-GYP domain-containing signal transduction protein [Tamilnaduibacter salinus]|uniref:EAL and modified HD-GYP domain-containing signal transduction protein n=1 Tax=Tamilnaduibacter salinus TaxID=1484056 RepID=A0A2U1CVF4_9GAMM|nr:HDOD domain-containing protein [Tamilnaduibacter salinus]PVY75437.1 EAL and modified HD-GYP domain-containing signal transduction protein [Tamilnaduibacter salinus]